MYSIVLMATMTAGAEAPGLHGTFWLKHCFFEDCYPARYGWTCGPGQGGYYPTGYSSCNGCTGSCYGWNSCHGYSSCHGCWSSCHGCWSSCHGGFGLGYMWRPGRTTGPYSCYGCYGSLPSLDGVGYSGFAGTGNFGMYGIAHVPINPDPIDPLGLSYPQPTYANPALSAPIYSNPATAPLVPATPRLNAPSPASPLTTPSPLFPFAGAGTCQSSTAGKGNAYCSTIKGRDNNDSSGNRKDYSGRNGDTAPALRIDHHQAACECQAVC